MIATVGKDPVVKFWKFGRGRESEYRGHVLAFPEVYERKRNDEQYNIKQKLTEFISHLDGAWVVAGDDFGKIVAYNCIDFSDEDEGRVFRKSTKGKRAHHLLYHKKHDLLIAGCEGGWICGFRNDYKKSEVIFEKKHKLATTKVLSHSMEDSKFISGSFDHSLTEWDLKKMKIVQDVNAGNLCWAIDVNRITSQVVVGRGDVYIFDARDYRRRTHHLVQSGINISLKYFPEKHVLIGGDSSKIIYVWDIRKNYKRINEGAKVFHKGRIQKIEILEKDNMCVTCSADGTIRFLSPDTDGKNYFKEINEMRITNSFPFIDSEKNVFDDGRFGNFCIVPIDVQTMMQSQQDLNERIDFLKEKVFLCSNDQEKEGPFMDDMNEMNTIRKRSESNQSSGSHGGSISLEEFVVTLRLFQGVRLKTLRILLYQPDKSNISNFFDTL